MLTITAQAAAVLVENRRSAGVPDTYGVRIFAAIPPGGGARGVAVAFVPAAEPGDEVIEQAGVTAFVAEEVTSVLDEAVLDASPVDGGEELVIHR
jgi:iron-sulfur cluster assembly protein